MRRILKNPSYMTIEEMEEEFAGKWLVKMRQFQDKKWK